MREIEFTVSSDDINPATAYAQDDPRYYVAEMLKALQPNSQKRRFQQDLDRFKSLRVNTNGNIEIISQQDPQRRVAVATFLNNLSIDERRSLPIISYLQQELTTGAILALNGQFKAVQTTGKKNIALKYFNNLAPFNIDNLIIDGMQISLETTHRMFLSANHLGPANDDLDELERLQNNEEHVEVKILTTIDFAKLTQQGEKLIPGKDFIKQTVKVESLRPDIEFSVTPVVRRLTDAPWWQKNFLFDIFMWVKQKVTDAFNWIASKFSASKPPPYQAPSTQPERKKIPNLHDLKHGSDDLRESIFATFKVRLEKIQDMKRDLDFAVDNSLNAAIERKYSETEFRTELESLENDWNDFIKAIDPKDMKKIAIKYVDKRQLIWHDLKSDIPRDEAESLKNLESLAKLKA